MLGGDEHAALKVAGFPQPFDDRGHLDRFRARADDAEDGGLGHWGKRGYKKVNGSIFVASQQLVGCASGSLNASEQSR